MKKNKNRELLHEQLRVNTYKRNKLILVITKSWWTWCKEVLIKSDENLTFYYSNNNYFLVID